VFLLHREQRERCDEVRPWLELPASQGRFLHNNGQPYSDSVPVEFGVRLLKQKIDGTLAR
jgi:hypothetical protein